MGVGEATLASITIFQCTAQPHNTERECQVRAPGKNCHHRDTEGKTHTGGFDAGTRKAPLTVEVPLGIFYCFLPHGQLPLEPQIPGRTTEDTGVTTRVL